MMHVSIKLLFPCLKHYFRSDPLFTWDWRPMKICTVFSGKGDIIHVACVYKIHLQPQAQHRL